MSLPNLPKPAHLRRQQRRDGGYEMIPAYTTEEVEAWGKRVYSAALVAALVRIKATITCAGDTPVSMRTAITRRVEDLGKAALTTLPPPAMRVEALPAGDGKFVSINGHIHTVEGWEPPNVLVDNLRERLRASDDRYHALVEAIASGRALMPPSPVVLSALPEIDYDALIAAAYERHGHAQGTRGCVAFKHGAEWMRGQVLNPGNSTAAPAASRFPWKPKHAWDKCPACFEVSDLDFKCDNCGSGHELNSSSSTSAPAAPLPAEPASPRPSYRGAPPA